MKVATVGVALLAAFIFFSIGAAQERARRNRSGNQATLAASQVVNGNYFAAGELVEISGTINGDLYAAGGQVVIDGRVNGDILVAAGRVRVSGTVAQDVRVAGGQVAIGGSVGRNVTVAGGNVELAPSADVRGGIVAAAGSIDLSAPLGAAAKIAAGTATIGNRIGGDVEAAVGTLRIGSRADIQGNVTYWSAREASVSEGARVHGKLVRNAPAERPRVWPAAAFAWFVLISINFVSTLILGLLSLRFFPRFHRGVVTTLSDRPWAALATGFIAIVVLPVVLGLLFTTVLGIPLALILMAAFFILIYWSRIYVISRIGEAFLGRLRPESSRALAFLLGLLLYYILAVIPFIGWLVIPLVVLSGLGAELLARKQFYARARAQELI